jgi:hypothetical protein
LKLKIQVLHPKEKYFLAQRHRDLQGMGSCPRSRNYEQSRKEGEIMSDQELEIKSEITVIVKAWADRNGVNVNSEGTGGMPF